MNDESKDPAENEDLGEESDIDKMDEGDSLTEQDAYNVITHLPGVKGNARNAKTVLECRKETFEMIVTCTNQYMDTINHKFAREKDIRHPDVIELMAFIGQAGDGIEKFGLVMSIKRFKFLIHCLRFDDQTARSEQKALGRLAPVREGFVRAPIPLVHHRSDAFRFQR
ncbi:hypothetical protein ILUMI_19533 [Ignelater luminosus]|uniref:Uncharacterized protein n=1 Tax=Ignelater luminosus TaxID=2038154 RepID=A0A8K0CG25_IGNLU|nr:hypothetical protein ILUMI_19533 [Ignelater luminosus]